MNKLLLRGALCSLAFAASLLTAQTQDTDDCPHVTIDRVPAEFRSANTVTCGSNATISIGALQYTSPPGSCTLLVIYVPEHYVPRRLPGCNTWANARTTVEETIYTFECRVFHFLWIIPIDGNCVETGYRAGARLPNYWLERCVN